MTNQDNRSMDAADPSAGSPGSPQAGSGQALRQNAEALARDLAARTPEDSAALSPEDIRKMLHELRVHQIELEMQNEELRMAQAQIEAGRARYFDLYDLAPVSYFTLSEQGLILESNLTAATLLGTPHGLLVKQPISRFILKDDQDIYYLHRKNLFETGELQECELRLVKPDGALIWAHLTATVAQAEDGGPLCLVAISDISERKRHEDELRTARELSERIIEDGPVAITLVDRDGKIVFANRHAERLLGLAKPSIEARGYNSPEWLITDVDGSPFPDDRLPFRQVMSTGQAVYDLQHAIARPDAARKILSINGTPLHDGQGRIDRVVFTIQDITERKRTEEYLLNFKDIVSSTADGISLLDKHYRYVIVNKAYETFSGKTQEDLIGVTVADYLGEAVFREQVKPHLDQCLNGETIRYRDWFEYPTLGKRLVEVTYFPYIDVRGDISGVVANTRDITDRKLTEDALREERERLEHVLSATGTGIDIIDGDYNLHFVNSGWQKAYGDPAGRKCYEYFNGLSEPCPDCGISRALETRQIVVTEQVLPRENNKVVEVRIIPFQNAKGEWLVAEIKIDITQRVRAEEALKASEMRFKELLLNVASVAVQGYAMDGTVRYWNRASETLYGYSAEEALGQNLLDLIIPPAMRDGVRVAIRRMVETGETIPASEVELLRKDGSLIPLYSSHALVQLPGQEPELFCIDIDLTELKQTEAERERLQGQLLHAQKMESVGRLAGGVAHDFNNMLSVIMGYTELALERTAPKAPLQKHLSEVLAAARRSADLTRQLLAFARKQTIAPKVLDLNNTVEGMLNMLRRLIGENISLAWQPGQALWAIKMDPAQIDQILANLLVNARDAIAGVGRITVETRNTVLDEEYRAQQADVTPGEYVTLIVTDDGCGMDSKSLSLLFEPFFTTKEKGKGTGLGLATVYGIVKQNNGFINVYSEPGQGATFTIHLPRHAAEMAPLPGKVPVQTVSCGHETILLVEDEPAILKMTTIMLERLGYTVLVASCPAEAIRLASEHAGRIDLLITDVIMPEMNGRDLAKSLLSICPGLRSLFMSGYTADIIAHHGVMDEGEHFIQKPFSQKDLGAKVREAMGNEE